MYIGGEVLVMEKQKMLRDYLFRWIRLGQTGITIEQLLKNRGISKIAVYGYDKIAECIVYELEKSLVELECIIDRKGNNIYTNFPAITLHEIEALDIDAIVICPVDDYEKIKAEISRKTDTPLITFEELIYEL